MKDMFPVTEDDMIQAFVDHINAGGKVIYKLTRHVKIGDIVNGLAGDGGLMVKQSAKVVRKATRAEYIAEMSKVCELLPVEVTLTDYRGPFYELSFD